VVIEMVGVSDGLRNPPYGVLGGTPGRGGGSFITAADGRRRFLPTAFHVLLDPAEGWTGVSSGGGGYGDPLERPAEQVCRDIADGLYSATAAAEVLGVVVVSGPRGRPEVDERATTRQRSRLAACRGEELPTTLPTTPGAATWNDENLREGDEYLEVTPWPPPP
jgi:N-methylhydantoinase B